MEAFVARPWDASFPFVETGSQQQRVVGALLEVNPNRTLVDLIDAEVAVLQQMTVDELRRRYAAVMGEESRCRHKEHLIRKIAWRIQALADGDLTERARRRAKELANDADVRVTPPREL